MSEVEVKNEERPFKVEQLFYSRTDARGVIQSGNWVFQRVSGFSWEELIGAPHRLVRHPHMPKGVFHLLWDRIKAGKPTAAYIMNRAKDGSYYWVLANVTPVDGGYFSVRLKPTSDMLPMVRTLYAELLEREKSGEMTPAQSCADLLRRLREMGYAQYGDFAAAAMNAETTARAKAIDTDEGHRPARFRAIHAAVDQVSQSMAKVVRTFHGIRMVPSNMRIIAARLEPTGGPISTIAVNYSMMAREMQDWIKDFLESEDSGFLQMRRAIARAMYLTAAAGLQREVADTLVNERRGAGHNDNENERALLVGLASKYDADAFEALRALGRSARQLSREQGEMKRYVTGLASTRTLCRVENARLGDDGGSLDSIVESLDVFQAAIDAELTRISQQNQMIQSNIDLLLDGKDKAPVPRDAGRAGPATSKAAA